VASFAALASYFSSLEPNEVLRRYVSFLKRGIGPSEVQLEQLGISPEPLKKASSRLRSIGLERSNFLADILGKEEPGTLRELADALASMIDKLPIVVFDGTRRYVFNWIPDNDLVLGFYVDLSIAGQVRDLLAGLGKEVRCPLCFSDQFKGAPHKCARAVSSDSARYINSSNRAARSARTNFFRKSKSLSLIPTALGLRHFGSDASVAY